MKHHPKPQPPKDRQATGMDNPGGENPNLPGKHVPEFGSNSHNFQKKGIRVHDKSPDTWGA